MHNAPSRPPAQSERDHHRPAVDVALDSRPLTPLAQPPRDDHGPGRDVAIHSGPLRLRAQGRLTAALGRLPAALGLALGVVLTLAAVAHAAAAPVFVQRAYRQGAPGTSVTVTFPARNTAGNLIAVYVVWDNAGAVSLTDTRGNVYQAAVGPTAAGGRTGQIFYAGNVAAGTNSVTATFSAAVTRSDLYVHEYSGADRTAPVDAAVAASGTSTSMNSGSLVTRNANELLFAGGLSNAATITPGAGFRTLSRASGSITFDKLAATAGTYSASATQTATAWALQLAAFRPIGSAPPDTSVPTVPTGLQASSITSSTVTLSWAASTDNVGVAGYRVFRNGAQVATTIQPRYTDGALSPATTYAYAVSAYDQAANV